MTRTGGMETIRWRFEPTLGFETLTGEQDHRAMSSERTSYTTPNMFETCYRGAAVEERN
jgi:hypothetical protein